MATTEYNASEYASESHVGDYVEKKIKEAYITGAEWMLERVIAWLKVYSFDYIWYNEVEGDCGLVEEFEDALRNEMKG